MSSGEHTREYLTVKRNVSDITSALAAQVDPGLFAQRLSEAGLVSKHVVQKASASNALPANRIHDVIQAVLVVISLDRSKYHDFIALLRDDSPLLVDKLSMDFDAGESPAKRPRLQPNKESEGAADKSLVSTITTQQTEKRQKNKESNGNGKATSQRRTVSYEVEEAPDEDEGVLATDGSGPSRRTVYCYRMRHGRQDFCLIINNKTFNDRKRFPERHGTDADRDRLEQTFKGLGYTVRVRNNLTGQGMKDVVDDYATVVDQKSADSFVCCILSHGREGEVFGIDGKSVSIYELTRSLSESTALRKKPKIFFIQACQGEDTPPELKLDSIQEAKEQDVVAISKASDFFLGFATTQGTVSVRDTRTGSWYIEALCDTLDENRYDLVTMVTMVHNQVVTGRAYPVIDRDTNELLHDYRQQPHIISTLRHLVYFNK